MDKTKAAEIVRSFVREEPMIAEDVRSWRQEGTANYSTNPNFNTLHVLKRHEKKYEKVLDINTIM